ncbi:MAG TPA: DedA family protein [Dehalococcoidia bacterium]|nr:DedA family protein [Dehalococcoidia bacterium]
MLDFIEWAYEVLSWPGIVLLMTVEAALPAAPIPSELIMPFAGWFLIEDEGLGVHWVLLAGALGALGTLLGSLIVYGISDWLGRPFLERYGRYIFVSKSDLDRADELFERYGLQIVFFCRMIPLVRTIVSIPAGIVRMPLLQFSLLTFAGSFVWSTALAAAGYALGSNYEDLREWSRPAEIPVFIVLGALVIWYVYGHVRRARRGRSASTAATEREI